jgi:hypothetical protein
VKLILTSDPHSPVLLIQRCNRGRLDVGNHSWSLAVQPMATKVLVVYYSLQGHVEALAHAVAAGAKSVRNTEARLRRIPDFAAGARPVARWSCSRDFRLAQSAAASMPRPSTVAG